MGAAADIVADAAALVNRVIGPRWRYRSSITGRYVTKEYAEANPDTTERERA